MRTFVGGGAWLIELVMIAGVSRAVRLWQLRERGRQVSEAVRTTGERQAS